MPAMNEPYGVDITSDTTKCRNEGCMLDWVPDAKGILRCPKSCTMKRAADVPVNTPVTYPQRADVDTPERLRSDMDTLRQKLALAS